MKKTKAIALVLAVLLLACALPLNVYAQTEGEFEYTVENGEVTVTKYLGEGGDVVIPATLGGYPVTTVAAEIFVFPGGTFAKEIVITGVTLPDGLKKIEARALRELPIKELVIPASVTEIGELVISNCKDLETLKIGEGESIYTSKGNCIYDQDGVLILGCGASEFPTDGSLKEIGAHAFYGATMESAVLPEGLLKIGRMAFACSYIERIVLPDTLQHIGEYAFHFCDKLETIKIPDSVTEIGASAFYFCRGLKKVKLPTGLTKVEPEVFWMCCELNTIEIPETVTEIGDMAFFMCEKLRNILLPDGLEKIGMGAFGENLCLKTVYIPESVQTIGSCAFETHTETILCGAEQQPEGWDSKWYYGENTTVVFGAERPGASPAPGDINGDGEVNAQDYMAVKRFVLGTLSLTEAQTAGADVNGDGAADAQDYMMLKRIVLGTYQL